MPSDKSKQGVTTKMQQTRIAGNRFAPIPPKLDASVVTADQFMQMMFEFEYCPECGLDAEDHVAVIGPFGNWFAYCQKQS